MMQSVVWCYFVISIQNDSEIRGLKFRMVLQVYSFEILFLGTEFNQLEVERSLNFISTV